MADSVVALSAMHSQVRSVEDVVQHLVDQPGRHRHQQQVGAGLHPLVAVVARQPAQQAAVELRRCRAAAACRAPGSPGCRAAGPAPGSSSRGCRRGSPVPRRRRYAVPSPSCRRRCPWPAPPPLLPGPPWLSWPPWLPLLPLWPFPPSIWLPCGLPLPLARVGQDGRRTADQGQAHDQREHRTSVEHDDVLSMRGRSLDSLGTVSLVWFHAVDRDETQGKPELPACRTCRISHAAAPRKRLPATPR